jgi:hypothetical protein
VLVNNFMVCISIISISSISIIIISSSINISSIISIIGSNIILSTFIINIKTNIYNIDSMRIYYTPTISFVFNTTTFSLTLAHTALHRIS